VGPMDAFSPGTALPCRWLAIGTGMGKIGYRRCCVQALEYGIWICMAATRGTVAAPMDVSITTQPNDVPVIGDWDGGRITVIGTFRLSSGR
jgi:hypothetical protein